MSSLLESGGEKKKKRTKTWNTVKERSESGEKREGLEKNVYSIIRANESKWAESLSLTEQTCNRKFSTWGSIVWQPDSSWQSWNCCRVSEGKSLPISEYNANVGADDTKLLENMEAHKLYLLDCSLKALCERGGPCQSAVIRRSADEKRLFQVKIYVQVLMRQDKKRSHKAV